MVQHLSRGQNALRFWKDIFYDEIFRGWVLDPEARCNGVTWDVRTGCCLIRELYRVI